MTTVTVIGAGLAGSECAWQLAERGVKVRLIEQKPKQRTPAQQHDFFAELVCSNSFRGAALTNAVGLLKEEMKRAGSLIMAAGERARVPAGGAFAVDREVFGNDVTTRLREHPLIEVVEAEATSIPDERPVVLATGPLTGDALAEDLAARIGETQLAYYDAIAPVVESESINWDVVFKASRYDKGGDDAYGNCPLTEEEYDAFLEAVLAAEKATPREFEELRYFEGCLPLETMAERGRLTLAYGPMKPVGLTDPRTGERPFAVVQLRQENAAATAYNLVGFQTRMKWPEQKRVLRMIPGLEKAEFERLGSVHRNTFVASPKVLDEDLQLRAVPGVYLAGQITGVEGYIESAACGLVLGIRLAGTLNGNAIPQPPSTTALGALLSHLRDGEKDFQPSNVVWGFFPRMPGKKIRKRRERRQALADRALVDLETWLPLTR
ncbi:MAG: methylenetetrahydrofolate--tRNA-(uracil(54)-C(5))-methyltransferase (FADH(2)-oxidizing) TrmFO [Myxococcota bacterium]